MTIGTNPTILAPVMPSRCGGCFSFAWSECRQSDENGPLRRPNARDAQRRSRPKQETRHGAITRACARPFHAPTPPPKPDSAKLMSDTETTPSPNPASRSELGVRICRATNDNMRGNSMKGFRQSYRPLPGIALKNSEVTGREFDRFCRKVVLRQTRATAPMVLSRHACAFCDFAFSG